MILCNQAAGLPDQFFNVNEAEVLIAEFNALVI